MSKKNQVYLLIMGVILLAISTLFHIPNKLVLLLTALMAVLFLWASILLVQSEMSLFKRVGLFLLFIVLLNGMCGLWLIENHLLLVGPQSRYYLAHNPYPQQLYDGIYFSVNHFTHLGGSELMPANQTSRAISLIISLTGYLGLGLLVILGLKAKE